MRELLNKQKGEMRVLMLRVGSEEQGIGYFVNPKVHTATPLFTKFVFVWFNFC